MIKTVEKLIGSSYMLGLIHAEEENPERKINAADDTEIPPVAFEEAMSFLKRKTSITKDAFYKLEPKLRFRAFTVAKLGSAKAIEVAKQQLIGALEDGTGYRESWERIKAVLEEDSLKLTPGYWENVFRTNTQSAYIAGKLQQYENTGVAAYQLMVIEDSRTSKICRHLLTASGYGMILPVDHPFWKKYGFPPYHFQCRTSIRPVYPSQIGKYGNIAENPSMKSLAKFKPQSGFGGNPLERGNWWDMTDSMKKLAKKFGVQEEIEATAKSLGLEKYETSFGKISETKVDLKTIEDWENKIREEDWFTHGTVNGKPWRSDEELTLYGMDVRGVKEVHQAFEKVFNTYPEFKNKFSAPNAYLMFEKRVYADTYWVKTGDSAISFNVRFFKDWNKLEKIYAEDVACLHSPAGTSAKAIIYHEIGHCIDCYMTETLKATHGKKYFSSFVKQTALRRLKIKTGSDTIKASLSDYATKDSLEFFAEAIGEFFTSKTPRPIAAEVGKILTEELKALGRL